MTVTDGIASLNGARAAGQPPQRRGSWSGLAERLPRSRRQRRPALMAVGVLLVALCAAVSASLVARSDRTAAVLALARAVPAGHVLAASDVRVARVSGTGVRAMAASSAGAVVGETVTSSLPAGTLLVAGMVRAAPVPAVGAQVVAVAVKGGLVPAGVAAGRAVALVSVSSDAGRSGTPSGQLVASARVVAVQSDPETTGSVLSVVVANAVAPQVAQASAAGELAVTLLPVAP